MVQRHGAAITSIGAQLLNFFETRFTKMEDLPYTAIARAYPGFKDEVERGDRTPQWFVQFLAEQRLKMKLKNSKWVLIVLANE